VRAKGEIWILGTGAYAPRHLPVGVASRIGRLDRVFTTIREPAALWMPLELRDVELVRLHGEYTNRVDRLDNYRRIAERVLAAARAGDRLAYFTYGSPVAFDRVVSLVVEDSRAEAIDCRVLPATSSVDALLAFLSRDMAPGLQICEARWLVQHGVRLDPSLAALLFQPGLFMTDGLAEGSVAELAALADLRDYLGAFYPPDHPALFVRAPLSVMDEGYVARRTVGALERGSVEDLRNTSLYLPAAALAARLTS
jgi:Tetrapyrrole (Corrin/Porphyrin) Methylases